jgi:hypothetical protein
MTTLTAYLSFNVEIREQGEKALFTRPLLNVTGPVYRWWQLKERTVDLLNRVETALKVAGVIVSSVSFALGGA